MRINSWIQVLWRTCEDEEHRVVLCCCLIALDCNVCRRVCSLTRPGRSWNRLIIPTWLPAVSVNQRRWPMVSSREPACVDTRNQRWAVNHPEMRSQFVFSLIQLEIDPGSLNLWKYFNFGRLLVIETPRVSCTVSEEVCDVLHDVISDLHPTAGSWCCQVSLMLLTSL